MIKADLGLSKFQVTLIVMASVVATIPLRVAVGWAVDMFGGRRVFTFLMAASFLPSAAMAFSRSFAWLFVCRIFLGLIGAGFVVGIQIIDCWFRGPDIGKAEGIYAGWGNAGSAGAAFVLSSLGSWIGWRWSFIFSASLLLFYAPVFYFFVRDTPFGDIPDLKKARVSRVKHIQGASLLKNRSVILLSFIYAACFGAELTAVAYLPSYLRESFGLSLKAAGLLAGLFGLTVIFARPLGGALADQFDGKKILAVSLLLEGVCFVLLPLQSLAAPAVMAIVLCAVATHFSTGSEFSLVPSVVPNHSGKVAGYVGAGGNIGGLLFPVAFGSLGYRWGFALMGLCAISAALLVRFVRLEDKLETDLQGIWGTGRVVMIPSMEAL